MLPRAEMNVLTLTLTIGIFFLDIRKDNDRRSLRIFDVERGKLSELSHD
jgi:hypothetical protein